MFKWFKRRKCTHDYEITTKGRRVKEPYMPIKYYHVTTAICVTCGYIKELDIEKVDFTTHGKLIKVHRDPKHIYDWFRKEEAINELKRKN